MVLAVVAGVEAVGEALGRLLAVLADVRKPVTGRAVAAARGPGAASRRVLGAPGIQDGVRDARGAQVDALCGSSLQAGRAEGGLGRVQGRKWLRRHELGGVCGGDRRRRWRGFRLTWARWASASATSRAAWLARSFMAG